MKVLRWLVTAGALVAGILVIAVCAITFYEVVARYVFGAPTTWSIDASTYAVFWATFLAGPFTLREGGHVAVDVLLRRAQVRTRRLAATGSLAVVAAFSALIAWQGAAACLDAYRFGEVTMSVLRVPLYVPMAAVPVGCTLLAIQALALLGPAWRSSGGESERPEP